MFAAWLQTITGFAFALVLMGGIGVLNLIPLPEAAIIASILTILNGSLVIRHTWRAIDFKALQGFMTGNIPGLIIGYFLVMYLASTAITVLQILLGLAILGSATQMLLRPIILKERSSDRSFLVTGFFGGILNGMFSTGGPPVIWQMYRQPSRGDTIRATLLTLFVINAILRLGLVLGSSGISMQVVFSAAGALPLVVLGTWLALRFPPPLSTQMINRLAFGLLFVSGLALSLPSLFALRMAIHIE